MPLTFRPMTAQDIPTAAALWHEGWIAGHAAIVPEALTRLRTLQSFQDRLTRRLADCTVTEDDQGLAGFTMVHGNEIDQFYVAARTRGTGTAQAQMDAALHRLHDAGHATTWLACTVGNTRAARFYEKAGFTRAATRRMEFETTAGPFPIDIWRYEKALTDTA